MSRLPRGVSVGLLDVVFATLADATRRAILEHLRQGETTISQLAEPHDMSLPAVSKHVRLLEDAGLLKRRIEGRTHFISVNPKPLKQAMSWIERQSQFWDASFDRLAALVEAPDPLPVKSTKPTKKS